MVWSPNSPDGTKSVRANVPGMLGNTQYTETTLNNDHFWNIGTDEDGRHKFVNMPVSASDPVIATGMDAVQYLRQVSVSNTRIQGFFQNANGIFQYIPCYATGTVSIPSNGSFVNVFTIPANSYGLIWMMKSADDNNCAHGFFKSGATTTQAFTCLTSLDNSASAKQILRFGNGTTASGLDIRAAKQDGDSGTYVYFIQYWGQ